MNSIKSSKKWSWQKEVIIITFYSQSSYIYNWDDVVMPDYKMWYYECLWNRPWNMHHFIPGRAVYVQGHRGQIDRMLAAAGREKEKEREWVLGLAPVLFSSAECTGSMGDWESTGHLHATGLFAIPPLPIPSFFSFLGPLEHLPLPPICRLLCTLFPFTIQLKPAAPFQPQLNPQQCRYTCSRMGLLHIHTSRQHTASSGGLCSEKKKHPPCMWGSDALLCFYFQRYCIFEESNCLISLSFPNTHTARRKRMCRVYNSNFFLYCMKQILTFSHLKIQQVRQITQINTDLIHSVVFFNRTSRTGVAEHALTESPLHSEVLFSPQINLLSTPCMWYHLWMQKEDYESFESKLSLVIFPHVIWKQYPQASLLWKKKSIFNI